MRTTLYISNKEVLNFLERNGYTLITLRKIIISEFGYKNSEEFLSEFKNNISKSILNIKLAYKDSDEYRDIKYKLSYIITKLKEEKKYSTRIYGMDEMLFLSPDNPSMFMSQSWRQRSLYYYLYKTVFKRELLNNLQNFGLYETGMST